MNSATKIQHYFEICLCPNTYPLQKKRHFQVQAPKPSKPNHYLNDKGLFPIHLIDLLFMEAFSTLKQFAHFNSLKQQNANGCRVLLKCCILPSAPG